MLDDLAQWVASADTLTWSSAVVWIAAIVAVVGGAGWIAWRMDRSRDGRGDD